MFCDCACFSHDGNLWGNVFSRISVSNEGESMSNVKSSPRSLSGSQHFIPSYCNSLKNNSHSHPAYTKCPTSLTCLLFSKQTVPLLISSAPPSSSALFSTSGNLWNIFQNHIKTQKTPEEPQRQPSWDEEGELVQGGKLLLCPFAVSQTGWIGHLGKPSPTHKHLLSKYEESSFKLAPEESKSEAELGRGADIHPGALSCAFEASDHPNVPQPWCWLWGCIQLLGLTQALAYWHGRTFVPN